LRAIVRFRQLRHLTARQRTAEAEETDKRGIGLADHALAVDKGAPMGGRE